MSLLLRLRAARLLAFFSLASFLPLCALGQQPDTQSPPPATGLNTSELPPPSVTGDPTKDTSVYGCLTIFTRVLQLVRQDYVDEDKVDFRALTYNALRGMLFVGLGMMPAANKPEEMNEISGPGPDAHNRVGSFTGPMASSFQVKPPGAPGKGDLETAELYGRRIAQITLQFARGRSV